MRLKRTNMDENLPKGHGVVYHDFVKMQIVSYLMPFNLILGLIRSIYIIVRYPRIFLWVNKEARLHKKIRDRERQVSVLKRIIHNER